MVELVDTHAHLQEAAFEADFDETVQSAFEAGVTRIIIVGTTVASSQRAIEAAAKFPGLFAAVGIQPNYVHEALAGDWETIVELVRAPKVVALGETGLDLYWKVCPLELQIDYFHRHMDLSRDSGLPFIVHCRDAEAEVVRELQTSAQRGPLNGVMHSFVGGLNTLKSCLEVGMHISFAGMATYKNNHVLRDVAADVPAEKILVETDCPYLAPVPNRGKRNEPAWVKHTAGVLAERRGETFEEFAVQSTSNARKLFRLP